MFDFAKAKNMVKESIGEERYEHSIRVMNTAVSLASKYGISENKAAIAGFLHDCGRYKDKSLLLKMADDFDIILDSVMKANISLIHAPLGGKIAESIYGIDDEDILNAIRYHTTGRPGMSVLEMVVFMADYIEPERKFPSVDDIRRKTYNSLTLGMMDALDNTLRYVIEKGWVIHLDTVKARNYMKLNL